MSDTHSAWGYPIVLIQWGDPRKEFPDIEEISALIEHDVADVFRNAGITELPEMVKLDVANDNPQLFREEIVQCLQRNRENVQIVYIGAHGNQRGICFDNTGAAVLTYEEIAGIVQEVFFDDNCLKVVFGVCTVMSDEVAVESKFPSSVSRIIGFADKPAGQDVAALVAGEIKNMMQLYVDLHKQSVVAIGESTTPDRSAAFQAELVNRNDQIVLDTHRRRTC